MITSKKWICIEKFLPEKFDVDYSENVKKVIDYIKKRREFLLYEGKNPEQSYIFLPPVSDEDGLGPDVNDFNVGKFLVLLKRTGVVDNLYLPIFIKETQNKEVIKIKSLTPVWFSSESAVMEALEAPKEFRSKIPRFQIKNWNKFLEIEKQFKESKNKEEIAKYPIRKTALQNIAVEIKELTNHSGLNDFFGDFDIPKQLYAEGSKYDKVFSVLSNVSQDTLFKIIEETVHPLRFFGGDEERALQMQDLFSSFLQFDGYCFQNGKIVKPTPEILKEIKARIDKRKKEQISQTTDNGLIPTREPLHIVIDGAKKIEEKLEAIATKNEDVIIPKNKKRIRLPHFQSTPWKDVTIRFLDERNVLIKGGNKTVTADYEGLGFSNDKSNKPNLAWSFLFGLAKNKGETKQISSPVPDNIKQIKRQISDWLKKLFKNDTEPFYDFSETNTYKLKIALIPPQLDSDNGEDKEDRFGIKDYLKKTMISKYEPPNDKDEW